jgi:hypothetical protein
VAKATKGFVTARRLVSTKNTAVNIRRKEMAMSTRRKAPSPTSPGADGMATLLRQYGCGAVELTGTDNALYERHLFFDNVVN